VNTIPAVAPAAQTRSCAPFTLVMCWPGLRDEGKIHLESPAVRWARIARLSLVKSRVRRAAGDFPPVIRNCPRSRSTSALRRHVTSSGRMPCQNETLEIVEISVLRRTQKVFSFFFKCEYVNANGISI